MGFCIQISCRVSCWREGRALHDISVCRTIYTILANFGCDGLDRVSSTWVPTLYPPSWCYPARVLGLRRRLRNLTKGEPLDTGVWPLPTCTDQAETVATSDIEDSVTEDGEEEATATEDECDQIDYTAYINKPIYFNEDLTKTRAQLAKAARIAKNNNKINDTWVYDGKILIKEKNGRVAMINRIADLTTYT